MFIFHLKGDFASCEAEVALLWDMGSQGVEERAGEVLAYFSEQVELPLEGYWHEDTTDWLAKYYDELKPVVLGKLIIAAPHHQLAEGTTQEVIRVDPGMAFGTGHHETTQMALERLEHHPLTQKHVFDLGTGSGILAIAAMRLGAKSAFGIDNDPITIPIAEENAQINHAEVKFAVGDLGILESYGVQDHSIDVFIANIYAEVHAELAPEYQRLLKHDGLLIVTGIMREKRAIAYDALATYFAHIRVFEKGEWLLMEANH